MHSSSSSSSSAMVAHCADSARVCLNVCVFRFFRNAGSLEALGLLHLVFSPAFFGLEIAEIGPASSVLCLLFWFAFFFFFSVAVVVAAAALSVVF